MAEDVKSGSTRKNEPPGGGGVAPPFEPPSIAKYSDEHYHFPTDKVVFGVAAVGLTLARHAGVRVHVGHHLETRRRGDRLREARLGLGAGQVGVAGLEQERNRGDRHEDH